MKTLRARTDVEPGRRILVYGSGRAGAAARVLLGHWGFPVAAFLDSFAGGARHGLPVLRFDDYVAEHRRPEDLVIVACAYQRDVARRLRSAGIEDALDAYVLTASIGASEERLRGLLTGGCLVLAP